MNFGERRIDVYWTDNKNSPFINHLCELNPKLKLGMSFPLNFWEFYSLEIVFKIFCLYWEPDPQLSGFLVFMKGFWAQGCAWQSKVEDTLILEVLFIQSPSSLSNATLSFNSQQYSLNANLWHLSSSLPWSHCPHLAHSLPCFWTGLSKMQMSSHGISALYLSWFP